MKAIVNTGPGRLVVGEVREAHLAYCGAASDKEKEGSMGSETKASPTRVDAGMGIFWLIGWLFTVAFAKLVWWQAILGLVIWPYFLGVAAR